MQRQGFVGPDYRWSAAAVGAVCGRTPPVIHYSLALIDSSSPRTNLWTLRFVADNQLGIFRRNNGILLFQDFIAGIGIYLWFLSKTI